MAFASFAVQETTVGGGDGSITVTNATEGKTYRLYKLFDATYAEDSDTVSYTYTKTGDADALFALLTVADSPFTLTQVRDTDTYVVTTDAEASEISAWIKNNLTETDGVLLDGDVLKAITSVVAEESEIKFTDLEYGYYFITSTLGTTITVSSNTPDINVIDKNQGPSWDVDEQGSGKVITSDSNKTYIPPVQENSVNVGDTVNFKIGVNTTNYNGDRPIVDYFINDALDKGFVIDKTSLVVKLGETELTSASVPALGQNYKIEWDDENNSFRITVPWYDEETGEFASADANNVLTVTYSATLVANPDTEYAGEGNKNTATYDFRDTEDAPTPGDEPYHTVEEKETTTYTFALGFSKIDGKTKEALPGAEFVIKDSDGKYIAATGNNGDYTYSAKADTEDDATVFKTDAEGMIIVKGVAEGTYTVIETKAPEGYNLLTSEMTVTASIASSSTYTTTHTTYYDHDGNVTEEEQEDGITVVKTYEVNAVNLMIENNAGTTLPETGGIGTTIFYIVGALLVVGAVVLLVTKKRMSDR
jgi:LPXTG-motif cell wall-anchored protein